MMLASLFMSAAQAQIKTEEVTYEANGVKMHGYVAYNETLKGKLPVVLVVHEWWGLNDYAKQRARQIAELGYFAFAVDMFGEGKIAENPEQAMALAGVLYGDPKLALTRMNAAVEKCKSFNQAHVSNTSAIGYCFGGSMVLNSAKQGMDLKAAVSFHGGLAGVPAEKGKTSAQILVCHGGADPFVPEKDVTDFKANCDGAGVNYTFIVYEGATHAFSNPYSTEAGKKFNLPIAYNEKADHDSWNDMKNFFGKVIKK